MVVKKAEGPGSLSKEARLLAALGDVTAKATEKLAKALSGPKLSVQLKSETVYTVLGQGLRDWADDEAAQIVDAVADRILDGKLIQLEPLARWMQTHICDAASVIDCLALEAPLGILITERLSKVGSQKLVFGAHWRTTQAEVVVKRFLDPDSAPILLDRELRAHALSMEHPNIIETHHLKNDRGEDFLVERRLPVILDDDWHSEGIQEAANLMCHIARALAFLEDQHLVHGDVKPDNIGFEDGLYILLDFGICRPVEAFTPLTTPTGSIRTRAPEVILGDEPSASASDVWALGATIFNATLGRFPLFAEAEDIPRVSNEALRAEKEDELKVRINEKWEHFVDLSSVPEALRGILHSMLRRDPAKRLTAHEVVRKCEEELSAFIRMSTGPNRLSPVEEVQQIARFLPTEDALRMMPFSQLKEFEERLKRLLLAKGLGQSDQKILKKTLHELPS